MSMLEAIRQVSDDLRALVRRFVLAFQSGDDGHPDDMIEFARQLEASQEGAAFVRAFLAQAMRM